MWLLFPQALDVFVLDYHYQGNGGRLLSTEIERGFEPLLPTSYNNAVRVSLHRAGKLSSRIVVDWFENARDCKAR